MTPVAPIVKDLVLVGGGHANIQVLKNFAQNPLPGVRVTLVSDVLAAPYSGMLPGHLAGWYDFDELHFDLHRFCLQGGFRFVFDQVVDLDPQAQILKLKSRPALNYDVLSLNTGITPAPPVLSTDDIDNFYALKPIAKFLEHWQRFLKQLSERQKKTTPEPLKIAIVGGGTAGCEIALILAARLKLKDLRHHISILTRGEHILIGHHDKVKRTLIAQLQSAGVQLHTRQNVRAFDGRQLHTEHTTWDCDFVFCATEAQAANWLKETGLALSPEGFLQVDHHLNGQNLNGQSCTNIFAAGDCAQIEGHHLPRAGVHAVRQGPILTQNIRHSLGASQPQKTYRPPRRILALITSGEKRAVASYGAFCVEGSWVWHWKDWLDKKFMRRFSDFTGATTALSSTEAKASRARASQEPGSPHFEPNTCGGCGAKVSSDLLRSVLARLRDEGRYRLSPELGQDDAAVLPPLTAPTVVHTTDTLRSFLDDPYLIGRIAATHALSDIYAMGCTGRCAEVTVQIPANAPAKTAQDLYQVLSGVCQSLTQDEVTLIGGHTSEGPELSVGLSVIGDSPHPPWKKAGAQVGDLLALSQPLGSGALLKASMMGDVSGPWLDQALRWMQHSSKAAVQTLRALEIHAGTDVTGFGLAGHLIEMLKTSPLQARLTELPQLDGFADCVARGHSAFLSTSHRQELSPLILGEPSELLFDPQTSGGLLVATPTHHRQALQGAGFWIVGQIEKRTGPHMIIL